MGKKRPGTMELVSNPEGAPASPATAIAGKGACRSEAAILRIAGDGEGCLVVPSAGGVSRELELQLRMGRSWLSCLLKQGSRKLPARTAPTRPRRGGGVGARAPSSSSLVLLGGEDDEGGFHVSYQAGVKGQNMMHTILGRPLRSGTCFWTQVETMATLEPWKSQMYRIRPGNGRNKEPLVVDQVFTFDAGWKLW